MDLVGRPDLAARPWFASGAGRAAHAEELDAAVGGWIAARTREEVLEFIKGYEGDGLSKEIAFDDAGDVPAENVSYWAYKNTDGVLTPEVEVAPEG